MTAIPRAGVVGAIIYLALVAVPAFAGGLEPHPSPAATRVALAQSVGGHNAGPGDPGLAYLSKLDARLQDIAANRGDVDRLAAAADRAGLPLGAGDRVAVDVYVDGDLAAGEQRLRALAMHVVAASNGPAGSIVEGTLPASALTSAAALDATHAILSVAAPVVETGSVLSQGDAVIHAPAARALGALGLGSGVGIISDSFSAVGGGAADSESTGDLSAPDVTILRDDPAGADEGRAMAEIVHDEAPLASIAFASGDFGPVSKAAAIDGFAGHANIIADDIVYPGEPFFQDDVIAQAVDRARARGTAYFAAAGNQRGNAWQGIFSPVPDPTGRSASTEDFDPGPAIDTVQTVGSIPAGGDASIYLQWAEPWGHATDDFAVDVYQINAGVPSFVYTVDTNNISTGIPEEGISVVNSGGSTAQFGFAIRRVSGSGTPLIKYIGYGDSTSYTIERGSNSGAIGSDAASARGAMTVAATRYSTPTTPEYFSSPGPVVRYFDPNGGALASPDVRQKPELAAPDGVATSVPGFGSFYGTSAAAPAAAGIAALLLGAGARPTLSIDELYAIMTSPANALACVSASPLNDCGGGLLLADSALAQAGDSTPPVIGSSVTPATPDGANGWYVGPVRVTFTVEDAGSPIGTQTGCGVLTPGDTATTFSCTASSAGGASTATVTIRRDSSAPTAPAIAGVTAGASYSAARLPGAASIGCTSIDATSGLASCTVSGYSDAPGTHALTATATNGAGLTSSSTLSYVVVAPPPPAAISGLTSAPGITLRTLLRHGMTVTVSVAAPSTQLAVTLVAKVPKAKGQKARTITLATLSKGAGVGLAKLHLTLAHRARTRLGTMAKATVIVTVSASASGTTATRLVRSSRLHR